MFFLDFVAWALAVNALLIAWFYGSIFEDARKYLKKRKHTFFGELLTCNLCLPYSSSFIFGWVFWLGAQLLPDPFDYIPRFVMYALAVTTLVHYMQGVLPLEDSEEDDEQASNSNSEGSMGKVIRGEAEEEVS